MRELYFEAREDKVDGGYGASAIGYGIHTQAETLEELRRNILDAVECYFDDPENAPTVVHLRVISEEVLVRLSCPGTWTLRPLSGHWVTGRPGRRVRTFV